MNNIWFCRKGINWYGIYLKNVIYTYNSHMSRKRIALFIL